MENPTFLLPEVVEEIHSVSMTEFGGTPGIKSHDILMSAISRAENKFYYGDPPPDLFDLAAAYAFGIVKNHAFHDGNKRTAWASCVTFLLLNGVVFQASDRDKEDRVVGLAMGRISADEFADWLRINGCYEQFWAANK